MAIDLSRLFKGSAMAFEARAVDPNDAAESARLENACTIARGNAVCDIVGPARIKLSSHRGDAEATVAAGERVLLGTRDAEKVYCRRG